MARIVAGSGRHGASYIHPLGGVLLDNRTSGVVCPMAHAFSSAFSKFRLVASEFRRDCANVDARMTRLESLRAETDKMIAESKLRIARCLTALDCSPSIVPEARPALESAKRH
jgi:hypothetical protein